MPESLRHPKNLATLAVEPLALPDDLPCKVTILQSVEWRDPVVAVLVELGDSERTVKIRDGDHPASLAQRIRDAAHELVDEFDPLVWLGDHFFDEPSDASSRRFDEIADGVRAERLRRIREAVRREYSRGSGRCRAPTTSSTSSVR